jgi:hypothetical protein
MVLASLQPFHLWHRGLKVKCCIYGKNQEGSKVCQGNRVPEISQESQKSEGQIVPE